MINRFCPGRRTPAQNEFPQVFTDKPGSTDTVSLGIDIGQNDSFICAPYTIPMNLKSMVKDELDKLLEANIVQYSTSTWSSPLVPVRKSDGSIRLCVDFRHLNSITVRALL